MSNDNSIAQHNKAMVKNASILMAATIISRIIGLLYRRPLGEVLGSVGLGYYGYASNLYSILLLVSSYSIPMAVSKIISERLAKGMYKNSHKIFKGALIYAVIAGGIAALIALFGGGILLPQNQANAIPALRALAPTILLSAILGVMRGYFQAHHTMTPTSMSQIAEQIVNAIVSILAAWILISTLAPDGGEGVAIWGAVGGTLGTGAGVVTGLIFMIIVYMVNRNSIMGRVHKDSHAQTDSYKSIFAMLLVMMTPMILTTFINNASNYIDSYIYAAVQGFNGYDADLISANYGEFSNYYIPMINIPLALCSASSAAMMPEVSGAYALGKYKNAGSHVAETIKLTMFICIPAMVGLAVLAEPIMNVLFPAASDLSAKLLMFGSVYVLFTALATVTGCALQAIGKQKLVMVSAAIALGINIVFQIVILFAVPSLDIYTVMISNILFSAVYCVVNMIALIKALGFKNELKNTYILPLIASAIMGAAAFGIYRLLYGVIGSSLIPAAVAIIAAVVIYIILYVALTGTGEEELKTFPMGTKLVKVLRKLKIYR